MVPPPPHNLPPHPHTPPADPHGMSRTQPKILRRHRKTRAGAVAALAVGGLLAGCGSSTSTPSSASATPAAATSSSPQGVPPGMGTTVTGAAADKAQAA